MVQVRTVSLIRATLVISRLMEIISSLNWKSALKRQLTDIKKTQWLRVSCQSRTRFGSVLDNSKTRTQAHWGHTASFTFLGLLWSPLLCTLIGPCGCHAVARPRPCCVVIGVCGAAAWRWYFDWQVWPPALPCLPTWRGRGWRGGEEVAQAGRGWALDVSRRRGWWIYQIIRRAVLKYVFAEHKADSTGTTVMASVFGFSPKWQKISGKSFWF